MAVTKASPLAERKQEAVKLRKAGFAPGSIARRLGFRSGEAVDKIVAAAFERDRPAADELQWQDLELARIDDLQFVLSARMGEGDKNAPRELMKLMEHRIRLQSARKRPTGRMYEAVQTALADLDLSAADAAAKQSALDMATMIDVAMSVGTADDQRRAINAMATMRNLLNDLGASPAAREELDGIVRGGRAAAAADESDDDAAATPDKGAEVLSFMERAQQRMRAAK